MFLNCQTRSSVNRTPNLTFCQTEFGSNVKLLAKVKIIRRLKNVTRKDCCLGHYTFGLLFVAFTANSTLFQCNKTEKIFCSNNILNRLFKKRGWHVTPGYIVLKAMWLNAIRKQETGVLETAVVCFEHSSQRII